MSDYRDDEFEWNEKKSADCHARRGFNFHAAVRIFHTSRYVERWYEANSKNEDHTIVTGLLEGVFISVVYMKRSARKRIISAFYSDKDDVLDYMVMYAAEKE